MEDIIKCIEYSGISKQKMKDKYAEIYDKARHAVNDPDGVFYEKGKTVDEITFHWFKNWLHPALKSRTPLPNPQNYNMENPKELEEYQNLFCQHIYENGQQNFNYTMDDLLVYMNDGKIAWTPEKSEEMDFDEERE